MQALQLCKAEDAGLFVIGNQDENDFLAEKLRQGNEELLVLACRMLKDTDPWVCAEKDGATWYWRNSTSHAGYWSKLFYIMRIHQII